MEMKLTYIAIHAAEPEKMKDFYVKYLGAVVDESHPVDSTGPEGEGHACAADRASRSRVYSLSFQGGVKIRLIPERPVISDVSYALACHSPAMTAALQARPAYAVRLTFTVGSRKRVNELTGRLILEGYNVIYEPGFYGMEHYSSSVFDPEGNVIELVA